MARAPVTALPGPSRAINLPSLRAWASAAEGARLADWVRLEAPTIRVLTALLTENRGGGLSQASYTRLRNAIATEPEAFFAARAAQLRARTAKSARARCIWLYADLILALPSASCAALAAHPGMRLAGLTATASTWVPGSSPGVTEEGRSGLGDGC